MRVEKVGLADAVFLAQEKNKGLLEDTKASKPLIRILSAGKETHSPLGLTLIALFHAGEANVKKGKCGGK